MQLQQPQKEGGSEGARIYTRRKARKPGKYEIPSFLLYHQNCERQEGLCLFLCWTKKSISRKRTAAFRQIHSTTVPLTVFTAAPAAPDMTHIEVFKGQFKFYAMEHYMCYTVLHPACVSTSDSCCPLTAAWQMIDYFIAHCMLWYRDSRLKPPNVILVNWNWSKWWQRWMLWVDSYQWNEINHNGAKTVKQTTIITSAANSNPACSSRIKQGPCLFVLDNWDWCGVSTCVCGSVTLQLLHNHKFMFRCMHVFGACREKASVCLCACLCARVTTVLQ